MPPRVLSRRPRRVDDRWPLSAFADEIAPGLEEQISTRKEHGVGALELRTAWAVNVIELGPERLDLPASLLKSAGIAVRAIGSPVGNAPMEGAFEAELARLEAAIDAAKRLSTKRIRVFSFFIPDGRYADFRDDVLRRMSRFAHEAAAQDVIFVHETESYIYGDEAGCWRDLMDWVGSPALAIAFDPANFVQVGVRPFDDAWPLLREHVGHFHVKDAVRVDRSGLEPYPSHVPEERLMASIRPAGQGDAQLPELLGELAELDYKGYLVIQPHLHYPMPHLTGPRPFAAALAALPMLPHHV